MIGLNSINQFLTQRVNFLSRFCWRISESEIFFRINDHINIKKSHFSHLVDNSYKEEIKRVLGLSPDVDYLRRY